MKRKMIVASLALVLVAPINILAEDSEKKDNGSEESGFFGSLILGGGYIDGELSQLEVGDDNEIASSLYKNSKSESAAEYLLLPELGYVFESTGTVVVLGAEAVGAFGLTIAQPIEGVGIISITGKYDEDEVWKDPYITGVARKETDVKSVGTEVSWDNIFETGVKISYSYDSVEIDDDLLGKRYKSLQRDGVIHTAGLGWQIPITENHILTPFIYGSEEELDGESNSNSSAGGGIEYVAIWKKISFETSVSASTTEFDKKNPIYGKTREEDEIAFNQMITYAEPFGFEDYSAHLLLAYSMVDSNINFFDSEVAMVGFGVGYHF